MIFTGLPRKALTLHRQRWTLDTSAFLWSRKQGLQDSPKASPRADRVRGRKGEHKTYCMYNYSYSHSISNWPAQQALTSASARKGEHQGLIPLKKQLLTVLFGNDGRQEKNMFFVAQCCPFARSHPRCIKMLGLCFRVYVRCSQGPGTDPAKDSMPRACRVRKVCLVTSPKTVFVCIWLLLIVCLSFARSLGWPCPRQHAQGMPSWVRCPNLVC